MKNIFLILFFLINSYFASGQNTEEVEDSLRNLIVEKNQRQLQSVGDYVFQDTLHLKKYTTTPHYLQRFNKGITRQDKVKAIKKVSSKEILKLNIKNNKIYLIKSANNTNNQEENWEIDIDSTLFLIDLNNDGVKEIVYYNDNDYQRKEFVVWFFDKKQQEYNLTDFLTSIDEIESIEVASTHTTLKILLNSCCADASDKLYEYELQINNNNKITTKLKNAHIFSSYSYFLPKNFTTPTTLVLQDTTILYSKPLEQDKLVPKNGLYYRGKAEHYIYTYRIGQVPKGTKCTILNTYQDKQGQNWYFVEFEKGYKPPILVEFDYIGQEKQSLQLWAWVRM